MLVDVHGSVTAAAVTVNVKVDWHRGVGAVQGQLSKVAVTEMGNAPVSATFAEPAEYSIVAPVTTPTKTGVVELVSV